MIREAVAADIPRLVEMGRRFIRESSYRGRIAMNPRALKRLMEGLVGLPNGAVFVAPEVGKINGMIGVHIYNHPMSDELVAAELFWWVEPEARGVGLKLLKRAERWAENMGASRMQVVAPNERVASIYQRRGFSKLEVQYERNL